MIQEKAQGPVLCTMVGDYSLGAVFHPQRQISAAVKLSVLLCYSAKFFFLIGWTSWSRAVTCDMKWKVEENDCTGCGIKYREA